MEEQARQVKIKEIDWKENILAMLEEEYAVKK